MLSTVHRRLRKIATCIESSKIEIGWYFRFARNTFEKRRRESWQNVSKNGILRTIACREFLTICFQFLLNYRITFPSKKYFTDELSMFVYAQQSKRLLLTLVPLHFNVFKQNIQYITQFLKCVQLQLIKQLITNYN